MKMSVADWQNPNSVAFRLRKKRFAYLTALFADLPRPVRVLDVGGTADYWDMFGQDELKALDVTLLNVTEANEQDARFHWVVGDARNLSQYPDQSFDVIYSNSVIEHVGTWRDQQAMASEVRRVGRRYLVQTPNRYFPIEPHFLFPGFQFLPEEVKVRLLLRYKLGWFPKAQDRNQALAFAREIRLLTGRELRRLFPDARIVAEKFYGLTKSFMAIRGAE